MSSTSPCNICFAGKDTGDKHLKIKTFDGVARTWTGPLQDMVDDSERRQRLKDIFPRLTDEQLRQVLFEIQQRREVCNLHV